MRENSADVNGFRNDSNDEWRTYSTNVEFISCTELFEMMQSNEGFKPYLILDVRKREFWNESRINVRRCVNIEPDWINHKRMGIEFEYLIEEAERVDEYRLYLSRSNNHINRIVLMDWTTASSNFTLGNPLFIYNVILTKKDLGELPPPIVILDGGYAEWLQRYPQLTTNANIAPPGYSELPEITSPIYFPPSMNLILGALDFVIKKFLPIKRASSASTESPPRHPDVEITLQLLQKIVKSLEKWVELEKQEMKMVEEMLGKITHGKKVDDYEARFRSIEDVIKVTKEGVEVMENELAGRDFHNNWNVEDKRMKSMYEGNIKNLKRQLGVLQGKQTDLVRKIEEASRPKSPKARAMFRPQMSSTADDINLSRRMNLPRRSLSEPDLSENLQESAENVIRMEVDEEIFSTVPDREPGKKHRPINAENLLAVVRGLTIPGTTGLSNPRNLCYANSTIQCLSHISSFRDYFLNFNEPIGGDLSRMMALIMENLWKGNVQSMTIEPLKRKVAEKKKNFDNEEQQDCQEFLVDLFELLHDELKKYDDAVEEQRSPEVAMNRMLDGKSSIVSKNFYGETRCSIRCNDCKKESKSAFEVFSTYIVHLPQEKTCDLNECIDDSFNEQASDRECCHCMERNTMQTLECAYLPQILVIHLNRLISETVKNCAAVDFSTELEMNVVTSSGRSKYNYVLRAISCHIGENIGKCHYVSYCKNLADNGWYCYSDLTVSRTDESEVLKQKNDVYLLFYSKI